MPNPSPKPPRYKPGVDIEKVAPQHRYLYEELPPTPPPPPSPVLRNTEESASGISGGHMLLVLGVCAAIAVGAFNRMPYGYYALVRVATCFAAVALAVAVHQRQWKTLGYVLGAVGILYNPIIPIHLDRSTWFPINIGTIAALLLSIGVLNWSRGRSAA